MWLIFLEKNNLIADRQIKLQHFKCNHKEIHLFELLEKIGVFPPFVWNLGWQLLLIFFVGPQCSLAHLPWVQRMFIHGYLCFSLQLTSAVLLQQLGYFGMLFSDATGSQLYMTGSQSFCIVTFFKFWYQLSKHCYFWHPSFGQHRLVCFSNM